METHSDKDFLDQLEARADRMRENLESRITAGDAAIEEWTDEGITVRRLPNDPQGILRISVGGCDIPTRLHYCTFRGEREACIRELESALRALKAGPKR